MNSTNDKRDADSPSPPDSQLVKFHSIGMATETPYHQLRSSTDDFITEVDRMHDEWLSAQTDPLRRMWENFRMYMPVDGSSWDDEAYYKLKAEGRHPVSIDIASRKIDSLAGSIMSEKWDFDFKPVAGDQTSLTNGIKNWYYADKEQFDYEQSESKVLVYGLLHAGCEEIGVDYDLRRSGAITFWCNQPGAVLKDPYWQTDSHRDWKRAIKRAYFTAQEMVDKWETDDGHIRDRARQDKLNNETYGKVDNVDVFKDNPKTWGSKYLTLEYRWMERTKTTRLWARVGEPPWDEWIAFPDTATSRDEVQALMRVYGVNSFENLKEMPDYVDKLKLMICCPNLSTTSVLFQGDHDIQCGSIGLFWFSSCSMMGADKGIMEAMKDVQRTLNYRESKKDDIIAHIAAQAYGIDAKKLDDQHNSFSDVQQRITKPGALIATLGNPTQVIQPIAHGEVPASITNDIASFIDRFDRVSPVTPALQGVSERDTSGVLYEMQHAVTKLGTLLLYGNWRQHKENKGEAWYNQAQKTYAGMYRKVKDVDSGDWLEFNSPDFVGGQKVYRNSVEMLPRALVIVTLRKDSPTESMAMRGVLYDTTKILAANPELFKNEIRILVNKMLATVEQEPEEKRKIEMLGKMQEMADIYEIVARIENMKATGAQSLVLQAQAASMLRQISAQLGMGAPQQPEQPTGPESVTPSRPAVPLPQPEQTPEEQYQQVPTQEMGIPGVGR